MELARVLGTVVATVKDPSLEGYKLLVIQPLNEHLEEVGEPLVAVDPLQAGPGELVAWIGGREASLAMPHELSPADAAIVEIVDATDAPGALRPPRSRRAS
ncbi:MAG: EutN/CcmL family microcompartment protein [Myxococcota bacterium]